MRTAARARTRLRAEARWEEGRARRGLAVRLLLVALASLRIHAGQPVPPPDPTLVARGRQVFDQMKCTLCHSLDGKGGKLAVPLDDVGSKRSAASLRKLLADPQAEFPNSRVKMPVFRFEEGEREALVAFLLTLRKGHR